MEQLVDKACGYNEVEEVKKEAITLWKALLKAKRLSVRIIRVIVSSLIN